MTRRSLLTLFGVMVTSNRVMAQPAIESSLGRGPVPPIVPMSGAITPASGTTHILAEGYLTSDNEHGYALGNNLQLNARERSPQAKLLNELQGQRLVLFAQPLNEGA